MNLSLNAKLADGYKSKSQIARVLTENWVKENSYCPSCGELTLEDFKNNKPVADFYCNKCAEEFELKSKSGKITNSITDGAYSSMLERINSDNNPNFFFLTYTKELNVSNFLIIPKQFFTKDIIIKRKPLSKFARRAGWVGCNIDISNVTNAGKIYLIKNANIVDKNKVRELFNKTLFLRGKTLESKGWVLDIMKCVDKIKKDNFTLKEMYEFESSLQKKYPNNNFIKDKIRQQLQVLRDKGLIVFLGNGKYRKL